MIKKNENGRSMVEMLGVLAVVAVLSVGALLGYSKAVFKQRVNQTVSEIATIVINTQTFFRTQTDYAGLSTQFLEQMNAFPETVHFVDYKPRNAFGGEYEIESDSDNENKTFTLRVSGLPKEAVYALSVYDWSGLDSSRSTIFKVSHRLMDTVYRLVAAKQTKDTKKSFDYASLLISYAYAQSAGTVAGTAPSTAGPVYYGPTAAPDIPRTGTLPPAISTSAPDTPAPGSPAPGTPGRPGSSSIPVTVAPYIAIGVGSGSVPAYSIGTSLIDGENGRVYVYYNSGCPGGTCLYDENGNELEYFMGTRMGTVNPRQYCSQNPSGLGCTGGWMNYAYCVAGSALEGCKLVGTAYVRDLEYCESLTPPTSGTAPYPCRYESRPADDFCELRGVPGSFCYVWSELPVWGYQRKKNEVNCSFDSFPIEIGELTACVKSKEEENNGLYTLSITVQ